MGNLTHKVPHLFKTADFEMTRIAAKHSIDFIVFFMVLKQDSFMDPAMKQAAEVLKEDGRILIVGANGAGGIGEASLEQAIVDASLEKVNGPELAYLRAPVMYLRPKSS